MTRASARVAVHTIFSLVVSWPLVWYMDHALPNGTETPGTVAYFNLWTLRWNQLQIGNLFRDYWDAPIFHPEPGTFALSEPQPLTGLVFAPISAITGNPGFAYNVILLAALTLNGIAANRLCRRFGAGPWPAAIAGVIAQALPFVHNELGVEQLVMVFPLLFLADAILAWADEATWPRGLAPGAWLSVTFLTCGYYGLFAVVVLGPAALALVRRDWFTRIRLLQLLAALALFAVTSGPVLLGQRAYTEQYARPDQVILANSARPAAWMTLHRELPGASLPWLSQETGIERLYPGTVLLLLAVGGVAQVVEGRTGGRRRYAQAAFFGVAIVLAFAISLGLRLSVFGWQPYTLLRDYVPGFQDLRSPFRSAVLVQALLVPFAAIGLDWLWRGFRPIVAPGPAPEIEAGVEPEIEAGAEPEPDVAEPGAAEPAAVAGPAPATGWRRRLGPAVAILVVLVGLAEVWPAPQPLVEVPRYTRETDWIAWLAEARDPGAGDGSVAMYPFPGDGNYASYEATTMWMLAALEHGRPLVNGYSGLFPPSSDELEAAMQKGFPTDQSVTQLRKHRVSWVVVPRDWADTVGQLQLWRGVLDPVFTGRDMVILSVGDGEPLPPE